MAMRREDLLKAAQENPYRMFTGEEIAILCQISHDVVTKVKLAEDSPFVISKCRPEWFIEWMRVHPGFQLSKDPNPRPAKKNRGLSEPVATGRKSTSAGKKRVVPQAHENHITSLLQTVLECLQASQPGLCPAPADHETDGGV
jgi:hypothetical protein